jgi:ribosome maturation factor RimP
MGGKRCPARGITWPSDLRRSGTPVPPKGGSSNTRRFLLLWLWISGGNGLGAAHFFLVDLFRMAMNLGELLEKTLPPMGYELVDWESSPKGRYVRVFIDKPRGVSVEDCARVSRQLTRLFAVENVDFDRLEVSSPGLDRPLRKAADFLRFTGEEAELRLANPVANVRRIKGILQGFADGAVLVATAQGTTTIPLADIDRARLVPKIEWRKAT